MTTAQGLLAAPFSLRAPSRLYIGAKPSARFAGASFGLAAALGPWTGQRIDVLAEDYAGNPGETGFSTIIYRIEPNTESFTLPSGQVMTVPSSQVGNIQQYYDSVESLSSSF